MDPRTRLRRAKTRYANAKAEREEAIRQAAEEGMTRRAIAEEVGLTFQRVQQIVRGEKR